MLYDGSLTDEQGFVAMGGQADALTASLTADYREGLSFDEALKLGAKALAASDSNRELLAANLEVAVLDRSKSRRTFRRLFDPDVSGVLQSAQ